MSAPFKKPTPEPASSDPLAELAETLWRPLGVDGVYGRTGAYETVVGKLDAYISRARDSRAEVLRFPPVMSRRDLEKNGYLKSFPNLIGCVCALHGSEADIRAAAERADGNWTSALSPADLVLTPAACYPLYPIAAERGPPPRGGSYFDVAADCFRHEPSRDLDRLQSFRMREYVCIGTADEANDFREGWIACAKGFIEALGLSYTVAPASDPFFGRTGQMMAVSQLQQALKFELLIPVRSGDSPTACVSFNYHRDHFGLTWGLRDYVGDVAHTCCVAFGMDRLALALFRAHGVDVAQWPAKVRETLAL
jgi:seryl-tRNA synthetase